MKKMYFLLMLMITSLGFSQNLVTNGDFSSGSTGWTLDGGGTVVNGEAYFATSNATGNPWDTQLAKNGMALTQGTSYTLTFKARAAANRNITVAIQNFGSWENQTPNKVHALTTTMQTFTQTFNAGFTNSNVNLAFLLGMQGSTEAVYIDDVVLSTTPVDPVKDATLSDLKVDGTTVTGFNSGITSYTIQYPQGTTVVPQISAATTSNNNATKVINQASAIPGSATVVVTSQDGTVTKTYTVNYAISGPGVAAPTPPTRTAADVISLFSNAYTNIPVDAWSASWDDSNISDIQVAGNDTKKINFTNFIGVDFSGAGHHLDLTNFTHFHIDIWIDNSVDLQGKVFNLKLSHWGGTTAEVSAMELSLNTATSPALVKGQWLSIDVPLSTWSNNANRNDIAQFIITSNIPTVYFDNLYFHKNTLGVNDVNAVKNALRTYPNPISSGETLTIGAKVKSVEIFNMNGQLLQKRNSNKVSTQGLAKGVYLIKATTDNDTVETAKVIVK